MEIRGNTQELKEFKKNKMEINLCLYSNEKFEIPRKSLVNLANKTNIFKNVFEYDREWLENTDFYRENTEMLDPVNTKGDGWCLWKPYVILESLKKIKDGDVLIYMDSSDTFFNDISSFLIGYFDSNEILLVRGGGPNKNYTKRDTFFYMNCDSDLYWNTHQVEAGVIGLKKSQSTISFMEEYLHYCKDPRIMKDGDNVCGLPNFEGFDNHRYDQSVLTNLKTKYGISTNSDIRNYIECNMWESLVDNDNQEFQRKLYSIHKFSYRDGERYSLWQNEYLKLILDGKH
jgi:hypothetical protein